jgi:hypothetical protein
VRGPAWSEIIDVIPDCDYVRVRYENKKWLFHKRAKVLWSLAKRV